MALARIPKSIQEAKDQASEYFGFAASTIIKTKRGDQFEIPNPGLMDDDQQERWEELQFELSQCDREDGIDIPQRTLDDGTVIPAHHMEGELKIPYRQNGALLKPPYNVRLATALFGDDGYKKYKNGGGISNQIALEWARMNREYQERVAIDSKSGDDDPPVEAVSSGN